MVPKRLLTADEVRERLGSVCEAVGMRQWARNIAVDVAYISRVLSGEKEPAKGRLLDALGLERVVLYRQKPGTQRLDGVRRFRYT